MTGETYVWTGRWKGSWPGGRDGWDTSRRHHLARLDRARELVVVDAPSYPWSTLSRRPELPIVVRLPDGLDADDLSHLLGRVLLTRLTPYDRLLVGRARLRDELTERWGLADEVWLPWDAPAGDGPDTGWEPVLERHLARPAAELSAATRAKARFVQAFDVVVDDLKVRLWPPTDDEVGPQHRPKPRVAVAGDVNRRQHRLARALVAEVEEVDAVIARADGPAPLPLPDAVVVWLTDGGQDAATRRALFAAAHDVLQPGGFLVVVGHVVDTDDGRPNPRLTSLMEDLHTATGAALHLEELRSVRWVDERRTRGVVLRFTSLRDREV